MSGRAGTPFLYYAFPKTRFLLVDPQTSPPEQTDQRAGALRDTILRERCASGAIGIKLDVEGYEMEAVAGLAAELPRVAFLVAECSVRKRFVGGYQFSELVAALLEKVLFNVLNPVREHPTHYDCLFLPRGDARFR